MREPRPAAGPEKAKGRTHVQPFTSCRDLRHVTHTEPKPRVDALEAHRSLDEEVHESLVGTRSRVFDRRARHEHTDASADLHVVAVRLVREEIDLVAEVFLVRSRGTCVAR